MKQIHSLIKTEEDKISQIMIKYLLEESMLRVINYRNSLYLSLKRKNIPYSEIARLSESMETKIGLAKDNGRIILKVICDYKFQDRQVQDKFRHIL